MTWAAPPAGYYRAAGFEPLNHIRQLRVREDVRVVGQEHRLVFDKAPHPAEPLADRRVQARVNQSDPPFGDIRLEQLDCRGRHSR